MSAQQKHSSHNWLRPGESIVETFHFHWTAWIGNVVPILFATPVFVFIDVLVEHHFTWIAWIGCALGFLAAFGAIWSVRSTKLILTNERLIYSKSVLGMRRFEVPLDRIFNLDVEQHAIARLFNFGTLTVQSPSSTMKPLTHLTDPFHAQQTIYVATEELQVADAQKKQDTRKAIH